MVDSQPSEEAMTEWNPVQSMPIGIRCMVKTISGLERLGKRSSRSSPVQRHGCWQVHCWRSEPGKSTGDLTVIGWLPYEEGEPPMTEDPTVSTGQRAAYERSYKSMWEEVARARRNRDTVLKGLDAARDLLVALEHDVGLGQIRLSKQTFDALARLATSLRTP